MLTIKTFLFYFFVRGEMLFAYSGLGFEDGYVGSQITLIKNRNVSCGVRDKIK
jgi:MFS-type transporter involved in bile tolerance (Atg22 family)